MLDYEKWAKLYKPKKNKIDKNSPYNGCMFDTCGPELEYIKNSNIDHHFIWTIVDCDNEEQYIIPGYHLVNRAGYFITKNAWIKSDMEVNLNEMITVGAAKYACMEFLIDVMGLDSDKFEDQLHDFFSQRF